MMNVETVIVIPARGGSKNIPRKNLQLIKGKPLISYAIEIAHKVKLSNKVIVSTEDDEISEIGQQYGAEVIKRPHELAEDHINLLPVNQHVLKILESKNIYPKIIISLQPTAPFIEPTSIENAVRLNAVTVLTKGAMIENRAYGFIPPQYSIGRGIKAYTIAVPKSGWLNMSKLGITTISTLVNKIFLSSIFP